MYKRQDSDCSFVDEPGTGPTEISLLCVGPLEAALSTGSLTDPACTGGKLSVTKVDPPTTAPHSTELWNYLHGTFDMTWPAETGAPEDGVGPAVTVHIDF